MSVGIRSSVSTPAVISSACRQGASRALRYRSKRRGSPLSPGDWVLDIGANIGHYSARFSEIVGHEGHVVAFEPIVETFELLAANASCFAHPNVTLLNVAVSDVSKVASMAVPNFDTGLRNYYEASLTEGGDGYSVLCLPVDAIPLPNRIRLVKIDVEGFELNALRGMAQLLRRDRPTLIVEANSSETVEFLAEFGYGMQQIDGSHNYVFRHSEQTEGVSVN